MLIFQGVPLKTSNNATGPWGPLKEIHIAHSIALEVGGKQPAKPGCVGFLLDLQNGTLCRLAIFQGNLYKFGDKLYPLVN